MPALYANLHTVLPHFKVHYYKIKNFFCFYVQLGTVDTSGGYLLDLQTKSPNL